MGKVLLCNVDFFKTNQIASLCKKLNHECLTVKKEEYLNSIGSLCKISPKKNVSSYYGPELRKEMMIFCGIDSDSLDIFLDEYKKASISPIKHKAVVTPFNVNWNVLTLFEELDEHKY